VFKFKPPLFLFLILFLSTSILYIYAQEQHGVALEDDNTIYVIREIYFDIDGRSRPFALITHGEFKYGEQIKGKENFSKYLANKEQLLLNQRVLEEVSIEYFLGENEEDSALPVKLLVHVKDSWNVVILPYPQYTTSDGFSITIKARDYNFLGTMSAFKVDLGYNQKNTEQSLDLIITTDLPFQAAGLDWNLKFDHFFKYTFGQSLYYQNVTGLSFHLPLHTTTFSAGFNQYLTFNEEPGDESKEIYDVVRKYYDPYGATELFTSFRIPIGIDVGDFGELAYTPGLSGTISYPYGNMDEVRKPVTTFSHSIGFGRINWIGNSRKGLSASVGNTYSWYFDRSDAPLKITLEGDINFHWVFSKYLGLSSRLNYREWWQRSDKMNGGNGAWIPYFNAGDIIRGILDNDIWRTQGSDIWADRMLSLNLDLPVRILRFWPSEWFDNNKLRLFNFEVFLSLFTDMALLQGSYDRLKNDWFEGNKFSFEDMINTAGFEIIVFSGFFRSLKIRLSAGYNIRKIKQDGLSLTGGFFPKWDEIYIGTELHY